VDRFTKKFLSLAAVANCSVDKGLLHLISLLEKNILFLLCIEDGDYFRSRYGKTWVYYGHLLLRR
jgi:hypothetical protein